MCSKNVVKTTSIKIFLGSINLLSETPQEVLKAFSKGGQFLKVSWNINTILLLPFG